MFRELFFWDQWVNCLFDLTVFEFLPYARISPYPNESCSIREGIFRSSQRFDGSSGDPPPVAGGPLVLENRFYRVRLDKKSGGIASLVDKKTGVELVDQSSSYKLGEVFYATGGENSQALHANWNLPPAKFVFFRPDGATYIREGFYDHRNVSFVGRPFPLEEADEHFRRLLAWGFTFLRFLVTWEAVEHAGPGIYDEEYLDYLVEIVHKAGEHGLHGKEQIIVLK